MHNKIYDLYHTFMSSSNFSPVSFTFTTSPSTAGDTSAFPASDIMDFCRSSQRQVFCTDLENAQTNKMAEGAVVNQCQFMASDTSSQVTDLLYQSIDTSYKYVAYLRRAYLCIAPSDFRFLHVFTDPRSISESKMAYHTKISHRVH